MKQRSYLFFKTLFDKKDRQLISEIKKIIPILCILLLCLTCRQTRAQIVASVSSEGKETHIAKDTTARLKSFAGMYLSGKVYLKWMVANQKADGTYIIYRSVNGIDFEFIGSKAGVGVPIPNDITYFFIDELSGNENVYYKLIHISKNKSYLASEKITVTREGIILSKKE